VEDLVGRSINNIFKSRGGGGEQHTPVHIEGGVWLQCAYGALMSRMRKTRYQCMGCGGPAVCGPPGLREDTQLSQSSPLVIQSLSGVPEALSS
jgi:hypothetical protein